MSLPGEANLTTVMGAALGVVLADSSWLTATTRLIAEGPMRIQALIYLLGLLAILACFATLNHVLGMFLSKDKENAFWRTFAAMCVGLMVFAGLYLGNIRDALTEMNSLDVDSDFVALWAIYFVWMLLTAALGLVSKWVSR